MKTKIKICGLKRIEDVISVNVAEPDYCGFIFNVSGSRRSIGAEQLNILVDMLNPEIVPIGVFVNEKTDVILRIVRESGIRMVQLHGQENGEIIHTIPRHRCLSLRQFLSEAKRMYAQRCCLRLITYYLIVERAVQDRPLTGICLRISRGRILWQEGSGRTIWKKSFDVFHRLRLM